MKTPVPEVRELCAHTLQLCDYIGEANILADIWVVKDKAAQVKGLIQKLYGDEPVRGGVDRDTRTQKTTDVVPLSVESPGSQTGPSLVGQAGAIPAPSPPDEDISDLL